MLLVFFVLGIDDSSVNGLLLGLLGLLVSLFLALGVAGCRSLSLIVVLLSLLVYHVALYGFGVLWGLTLFVQ